MNIEILKMMEMMVHCGGNNCIYYKYDDDDKILNLDQQELDQ